MCDLLTLGSRAPRGEILVGAVLIAATSVALVASTGLETRYQIAFLVAVAGSAFLVTRPERRIACVVLWTLIHPFSIEKIFPVDASEGSQFIEPTIAVRASDGPLLLLALILIGDVISGRAPAIKWNRPAIVMLCFTLWSVLSYLMHRFALDDGFVLATPLALLQDVRILLFVLLVPLAIRSRGDVMVALLAFALAIGLQVIFVGISYTTGHLINYAASAMDPDGTNLGLQKFTSSGADDLIRASGTLSSTNEQAMFHTFYTLPLFAFLVVRRPLVRVAALALIAVSAMAIVVTFSRGAWIAFPLGLSVLGVVAYRRRMIGRITTLVGSVLALAAAAGFLFVAEPVYQRLAYGDSGATASRVRMLRLAYDLFEAHPLIGVGPGEYADAGLRSYPARFHVAQWAEPSETVPNPLPFIGRVDIFQVYLDGKTLRRPLPVHNKYMLVLSERGLPGLVLWLWFLVELFRSAWTCSLSRDRFLRLLGIAGMGTIVAELFYMMVDLFDNEAVMQLILLPILVVYGASKLNERLPQT